MSMKPTYEELGKRVCELENAEFERAKSEKYLREQKAFLENVFNALWDTVYIFDEDTGTGVIWNRSLEEIGGYDYKKVSHYPPTHFYPQEEHARIEKVMEDLKENGRAKAELNYIASDRRRIPFEYAVVPVLGPEGQKWICAVGRDITERKQAEAALNKAQVRLSAALESMKDAVFISDAKGKFVLFNNAFATFHKFSDKNECYETLPEWQEILDVYLPDGKVVTQDMWAVNRALRGETGINTEYILHRKDTGETWFGSYNFAPIHGKDGAIVGSVVVGQDVTERKKMEAALQEKERVMRYIIKYDPNAIAVYDNNLNYIAVSDRYLQDYSVKEKDVLGKHHYEVFPEMPKRWKDVHQRVLQGVIERNDDDYFERPDGSITYNRWECRPWYTADGSIGGMITYTEVTTDRKIAEKALLEAHQKLEYLIDFLPDPTFVIDNQGIVQMWNRAMTSLTGIGPEEIIGKGSYAYAVPFYGQERPMLIDMVLNWDKRFEDKYTSLERRSDEVKISQSFHPNLNGGIYLSGTARVLYDAEGKPVGAIETFRDVSEMKRAEMAVRASEKKYRNLFSSIRDAILVADTNREIVEYNPAFIDLFGYTEMEILGEKTDLIYANKQQFEELGRKLKENSANPQFSYTVWYRKKSGETFPGETSVYYLKDADGEVIGFIGLIRNVADRLEAEDTLKQSEARLKSLVDNIFDAILVTDKKGVILFANPAAQKLLGRKSSQIVGIDFGFPVNFDKAFEINILKPDNSIRQVEARATRAEWVGKQTYLISLRDITEKRLAEQERDEINLQLQQSQKFESIGNLAGGVAHDFNNLLTVIIGYGEHLLDNLHPSDPLHDYAREVINAGRRSADLTRQLLAFSRRQTLQPEVLDLNLIVKNIEKMIRRLIGEDIELTTILADDLDHVEVDPGQIEQVIVNLAVNARDAMPQGGKLTIETANVELDKHYAVSRLGVTPGKYVMFSISDNGYGMDKKTQERIFEPFYTTKEKGKGTGLGLSTVYGIVKQSGGNIWVYSEPGIGATFKIYLPRTTEEVSGKETPKGDESITGKGEMVLVVEDEPSLRKLCERMLKLLNYSVTVAANGGEALLLIEEKKLCPDLMITDVIMPEMGGKILVERLKKKLPDLKVLYMSGYTDGAIVHQGILDSGIPFIQKPFNKGKLGKVIRSVLDGV